MSKSEFNNSLMRKLADIFTETREMSNIEFAQETDNMQWQTVVYDSVDNQVHPKQGIPVDLVHGGTVATGYHYADEYRTAILNFADALTPGGLVLIGGTTQEENICRCSNLYEGLTLNKCFTDYYKANMKNCNSVYLDRIIYSADVCVFRDDITYERVEPKFVDVITCPAPSAYIKSDAMALRIYTKRIKNIINSAILNDVECLVLGAWGCGAFCQDPRLVSAAFVSVLNEYSGAFKKIVFAFRHTQGMESSSDYTPQVFLNEFNANYKWGVNNGLR
jgi:uncharacterized protein (TIGR02452 family)